MKNRLESKLLRLNVAIVSHIFATGPALDLEEYLQKKVKFLIFIGHPFSYRKDAKSFYREYKKGQIVLEHKAREWKLPEIFVYFKDVFYTVFWILKSGKKIDLYIGSDNFMAFLGLQLKRLGLVKEVVLYTIDFMQNRFKNPVLNWLYHYFDKQCLKYCKVVWNLSDAMAEGREKYSGLKRGEYVKQLIVPVGIWHKRIPKLKTEDREKYQIAFMGHVIEKQGVDMVIKGLSHIIKEIPQVKLLVIGTGVYEVNLKTLVKKLKLEEYVEFTGYVEKHEEVEQMLSKSTIAVATYKPDPESFTYFADPGKIKNYLSAGLPIILTKVPPIAEEIEKRECGFIVEYDEKDLAQKIISILKDRKKLKKYSENAVLFARKFDYDNIFPKALEATL